MTLAYWERHRFDDPAVAADRDELLKSADQNPDPCAAFLRLLRSGRRDAVCTALEYFHYQDRQARWGFGNPLDEYAAEVLDHARWVLRGTPLPEARGEDRASALWAIQNHAEAADAPLITAALRTVDGDVVDGAVSAAGQCLYACDVPEDPELVAQLGAMALDEDRPLRVRASCARALASAESDQAAELAVLLTGLAELELQMAGALVLTAHLDTHRPLLECLVATWPPNAPEANDIRDALEEDDDDA
ncbi:hypothetical protein ITI46_05150 [Streptomyces oryzae]|uniref:HEAT repeat domain-containing protein n=1 Tax=Streptomyces oryzae TaxID=1434886 RepID=A0ABS3X6S7_9ACTN|nr:hypothetical protein [Streptomyces oryzae]MBO8191083.1 hypothetical protein [Streptomyces oryzae]